MTETLSIAQLQDNVRAVLGDDCLHLSVERDEVTLLIARSRLVEVITKLRDDDRVRMVQLMDICGADYPNRPERFDVLYHLLSLKHNARLRLRVQTDETSLVPSVTGVYSVAGWFEREVWDMFGVRFSGNPDLRRILTDYGFEGHPLRKDFPLSGHVEVRYDDTQKRVVYEPVKLQQDYRVFDTLSPWEGVSHPACSPSRSKEGKS